MTTPTSPTVVSFPPLAPAKPVASQDKIWGKAVIANGTLAFRRSLSRRNHASA